MQYIISKKFRKYFVIAVILELTLDGSYMRWIPEYDYSRMYGGDISQNINNLKMDWAEIIMLGTDFHWDYQYF